MEDLSGSDEGTGARGLLSSKRRTYLIDDQTVFREGLRMILEQTRDVMVCGEATSAEQALEDIPMARPDLVITELSFDGRYSSDFLFHLRSAHPALPVLVSSILDELLYARRALLEGARGYIMKHQTASELKSAISQVLCGQLYLGRSMMARLQYPSEPLLKRLKFTLFHPLTDRELEVYELVGSGLGTREISGCLRLNVKTVETYRSRIIKKLGLKNGAELVRRASASVHGVPNASI